MIALVTGSGGLIGSSCCEMLCQMDWEVIGIDNNMRQEFFGAAAATCGVTAMLGRNYPNYRHLGLDIRDRAGVRQSIEQVRPNLIIHTAAQPSHDHARRSRGGSGWSTAIQTRTALAIISAISRI